MKKFLIFLTVPLTAILLLLTLTSAFIASGDTEEDDMGWNAGGGGQAIVEVALSQVGNVGGRPYWSWYGFGSRVAWCACFVSWCANECGYIDQGIIPKFSYCPTGVEWFKSKNQWKGKDYTPKAGDIVFFDWNGDEISDHVGIVQYAEGDRIVTVEGNTSSVSQGNGDTCEAKSRATTYVMGYGTPAYPEDDAGLGNGATTQQVYNYLRSKGFSKEAACGILGNMWWESGVDPTRLQSGRGPAAGICQWENYNTKSGRWKAMSDYAASKGKQWTDLQSQLEFLMLELNGADSTCKYLMDTRYGGLEKFKKAKDVVWATEVFEKCFERAGIPMMSERISQAKLYYKQFQ